LIDEQKDFKEEMDVKPPNSKKKKLSGETIFEQNFVF